MSIRTVKDEDGREWELRAEAHTVPGRDVELLCMTKGFKPFRVKVSWKWAKMAERGLARMILDAAPELVPAK
jgi:hypothetical protein